MNEIYSKYVPLFKAMSDETRLKIIDMLSCGEMCACDILEEFNITQPTLSYHMKILTDSGLALQSDLSLLDLSAALPWSLYGIPVSYTHLTLPTNREV